MHRKRTIRRIVTMLLVGLGVNLASPVYAHEAQNFLPIFEAVVRLQSATSSQEIPAYGHLGFASPLAPPVEGSQLELSELAFDIPSGVPLGSMHLVVEQGVLTVASDGSAQGTIVLRVSLPLYNLELRAVATGFLRPTRPPFQFRYNIFDLKFAVRPNQTGLDPVYHVRLLATIAQETVTRDEIDQLIADLDNDNIEIRARAQFRLVQIGRAALGQLQAALPGAPLEQRLRLESIIRQTKGVTTVSIEWIGDGVGVYVARFNVHVAASGKAWTRNVHDLHFIVGTPVQSRIDHNASTISLDNFPEGWRATYNPTTGEYQISSSDGEPLQPCKGDYIVEIRTGSILKPGDDPAGKLGDMGWYYTDSTGRKIGDAGRTKGLVLPK
jgi:hypothetical protein